MIISASTLSPQYMTTAWTSCPFVHYEQTTFSAPFESHPVPLQPITIPDRDSKCINHE